MLLTLALVILFSSIVVMFSQEFIGLFKKIISIKGVSLFLPLFVASWLIYTFNYWALWVIYYYREILHYVQGWIVYCVPFPKIAQPLSLIMVLELMSVLPIFLLDWYLRKTTFKRYEYPYVTSTLIFIASSILLLAL